MAKTLPLPANQVGSACERFSFDSGSAMQIFRRRATNRSSAEERRAIGCDVERGVAISPFYYGATPFTRGRYGEVRLLILLRSALLIVALGRGLIAFVVLL